jgi:chromosomal replication initiator protein
VTTSGTEVVAAWELALTQLIGEPRYQLWFNQNTKLKWDEDRVVIGVPNRFFQEWLQNSFAEAVRIAAANVFGRPMEVRFAIDPELFQAARRAQTETAPDDSRPRPSEANRRLAQAPVAEPDTFEGGCKTAVLKKPRHWRQLSDFVVGPCNRVAHASAVSVVEAPAENGNPLVLHGPVGTGKTHLLEGIYAGLRRAHPHWRVRFITSEEFTNRFLQAMRAGKLSSFRNHYRECDALLIDDLHFLATKRATQEEFLHTFDVIHSSGRQLVVTCDCHPKLADELTPELADRLVGGAVWSIAPPNAETRLDILRAKAGRGETIIPEDVLRLISDQLRGNVRELEGALHSVRHLSRVTGRPVDLALAREALGDLLRHSIRVVQLAEVDRAMCQTLRLEGGALQSKQRNWAVSHPRMVAMFLARKHTAAAYSEIGQHFGGRNHSTAVAAERKVRRWLENNQELAIGDRLLPVRDLIALVERELLR